MDDYADVEIPAETMEMVCEWLKVLIHSGLPAPPPFGREHSTYVAKHCHLPDSFLAESREDCLDMIQTLLAITSAALFQKAERLGFLPN